MRTSFCSLRLYGHAFKGANVLSIDGRNQDYSSVTSQHFIPIRHPEQIQYLKMTSMQNEEDSLDRKVGKYRMLFDTTNN